MMNFNVCNSNQNIFNNKYSLEINKNCNENNVESCIFKAEKSGKYYVANKDAIIFFSHPYSMLQIDQGKYENALQFLKANQKLPKDYSDKVVDSILSDKPDQCLILVLRRDVHLE